MRSCFTSFLAASLLLAGCSGGSGSGPTTSSTTVATSSQIEDLCAAQCDRSERCDTEGVPPEEQGAACVDGCLEHVGSLATSVRSDFIRELTECTSALECGTSDDICTDRAFVATGGSIDAALHSPDVEKCLQKRDECRDTSGEFSDDTCGTILMLVDAKRAQTVACFDGPCADMASCLEPIFGP